MKKIYLFALILSAGCLSIQAQEKRINLYGAYVFDDDFSSTYDSYNYYHGTIKAGFQYGAGLEFMPHEDMGVELLWQAQTTTAPTYYSSSSYLGLERYSNLDVNLNYAMLGINRYGRNANQKVEGFGGLMLGALFVSAKDKENGRSGSATKFAWGFRAGANIWASDKIAIKIQGQLLSAVQSVGGSLYFGTGGSGAGVSTYSSMLQFSIGGGLAFSLGKK